MMRAVQVDEFGDISKMHIAHLPRPVPGPGQVLVAVQAAGVGPWDALVRSGTSGIRQPLPLTLGADLSGIVAEVGAGVLEFTPGDCVFGSTNNRFVGAYADFALADANRLALKPAALSFIETGGISVVAVTAWAMLFEHGRLRSGQRVLVHGAGGSVGNLAVQLARESGARVVATCRARDGAFVAELGADEVVDFEADDFVEKVGSVDLVIDTVGGATQRKSFEVLGPEGAIVSIVSEPDQALAAERRARAEYFIVDVQSAALEHIGQLLASGLLRTDVGEVLTLPDAPIAHEMLAGRPHRRGKIVLDVRAGRLD